MQEGCKLFSVILSGGSGTRLWPASREYHPKSFMKLADGETLIQKTYARVKALGSEFLAVTNRDYYFMSRDEQERVGVSGGFLLEPFGRNTAPAIALAAKLISKNQSRTLSCWLWPPTISSPTRLVLLPLSLKLLSWRSRITS